jgi:hypothetical protein
VEDDPVGTQLGGEIHPAGQFRHCALTHGGERRPRIDRKREVDDHVAVKRRERLPKLVGAVDDPFASIGGVQQEFHEREPLAGGERDRLLERQVESEREPHVE